MTKPQELANEVAVEVERAQSLFAPINGPHEGYGVIKEEFDEFWDEVKKYNLNKNRDTRPQMRAELIQLAAMCLRTIHDVIDVESDPFHDQGNGTNHRISQCTEKCKSAPVWIENGWRNKALQFTNAIAGQDHRGVKVK